MRYTFDGFTKEGNKLLCAAIVQAQKIGAMYVGTEHVLLALLCFDTGDAAVNLLKQSLNYNAVLLKVKEMCGCGVGTRLSPKDFSSSLSHCINYAIVESRSCSCDSAAPSHVVGALLEAKNCTATKIFTAMRFNTADHLAQYRRMTGGAATLCFPVKSMPRQSARTVDKYTRNMTLLAMDGKFDPVIGRDDEITQTLQVLLRRRKNNPCLVGDAGVGKTAIIEALAQKIADGKIAQPLKNKQILALDMAAMVAGTKYRGDFEERFKTVLTEVQNSQDIILFIDELHIIMGAGAAEGGIDASGILKPVLARGEIRLIGATTHAEYKATIEKDAALERRFGKILVEEPSESTALNILKGLATHYERHHGVTVTQGALESAVKLSTRYLPLKKLPDKAIDLLDEACAKAQINLAEKSGGTTKIIVDKLLIAKVCARQSNVPLKRITLQKEQVINSVQIALNKKIIGQEHAVKSVCALLRQSCIGIADKQKPLASLMFLGPSGVGKTALAHAVAQEFFGGKTPLLRFDMSEYMESHAVSRLLGAPPGYVGHGTGGQLTEPVRKSPYCAVLFDEIEKAHPDMTNILLQILDYGCLTDSDGRKTDFSNTIIILTSNIGAKHLTLTAPLGFSTHDMCEHARTQSVMAELKSTLRPELLGRLDDTVIFKPLDEDALAKIADNLLKEVKARAQENKIHLTYTHEVPAFFAKCECEKGYGARDLRKAVLRCVSQCLAGLNINDEYKNKNIILKVYKESIVADVENKKITLAHAT